MPALAARMARAGVAATIAMTVKARELRAAGVPVISLTIGEPDFSSPPGAIEAAHRAALAGDEAEADRCRVRARELSAELGVPVSLTVAR